LVVLDAGVEEVDRVRRHALEGDVEPCLLRAPAGREKLDGEVLLVEAQVDEEGVVDPRSP